MSAVARLALSVLIAICALCGSAGAQEAALLANGDMESDADGDRWPDGWPQATGLSWKSEAGGHYLSLSPEEPGGTVTAYRSVPLPRDALLLELSYRVRYSDIQPGTESWHDGRIILHFKDADGRELQPAPANPAFRGSSDGWLERDRLLIVPDGATVLEFMPALFSVQAGTLDVDDVVLRPATAEPFEVGAAPVELHVDGNRVLTADGDEVWLQGLNIPSLEWAVQGEHLDQSVEVAIDEWHANIVRLPVSCGFWFGGGPGQDGDGSAYRERVAEIVAACSAKGAYVILDLHEYRAPKRETLAFWHDAAARFANHPGVLFGLLNEPHDIDWETWRNGGTVTEQPEGQPATEWHSPGMQRVFDVVRETGARNIVTVGGLDWAYDLSGVVNGYALEDASGNGILYDSHIYPWKGGWRDRVLVAAAEHPVLIGECGCEPEPMPFVPPESHKDPAVWAPDLLGFIQANRLHWTAWCFHPGATPRLLQDWDYTPTPYWGAYAKAALLGEQFTPAHEY